MQGHVLRKLTIFYERSFIFNSSIIIFLNQNVQKNIQWLLHTSAYFAWDRKVFIASCINFNRYLPVEMLAVIMSGKVGR